MRGRVRLTDRLHVLHLRSGLHGQCPGLRSRAPAAATRSSFSAAGRTGSVRGSSSTTAAATPHSRLSDAGFETIMVNCNPETVSTDYDTSDRLYFEPLTAEDVIAIIRQANSQNGRVLGVIVQFGGQTPLKLAQRARSRRHCRFWAPHLTPSILRKTGTGSRPWSSELGLKQPPNGIAHSGEEARQIAAEIGYPVVIRPSFVLGGRAMEIVADDGTAGALHRRGGDTFRTARRC